MSELKSDHVTDETSSHDNSILTLPAYRAMRLIENGSIGREELFTRQLEYAKKANGYLKAFYEFATDKSDDEDSCGGEPGFPDQVDESAGINREILHNIPISVKDIFAVRGFHATAGSRILADYRPPYDSTVIARSKASGNYIIGKTSLDEFAMGSSNETSAFGPCFNPWDVGRVPGGSSGGGAVSVAACQSYVGWGTDTGGSVRLPASFCGIVGYKPSYGLLSRFGIIAYVSSLDSPSIFARAMRDIALTMNAVCYPDSYDASVRVPDPLPDFVAESEPEKVSKPRFAVIKELVSDKLLDPRVSEMFFKTVDLLKAAGATVDEVSFSLIDVALPAYYIITTAECSSNLARFDGVRYGGATEPDGDLLDMYFKRRGGLDGFGAETKRRILLGTYVLSSGYFDAYYNKARALRRAIMAEVARLCERYDALIFPTSPDPAFKVGERIDDPVRMYLSDIATVIANLAGSCAVNLPCGTVIDPDSQLSTGARRSEVTEHMQSMCRDAEGQTRLPVGIQMIGRRYGDADLLKHARWFETVTRYGYEIPPLVRRLLGIDDITGRAST